MLDTSSYLIRIIALCQLGAFIYAITSGDWRLGLYSYVTTGLMMGVDPLVSTIFTSLTGYRKADLIAGEAVAFAATFYTWCILVGKTPTLVHSLWAAQYLVCKAASTKMFMDRLD
jgi:hypothetical protein